MGDVIDIRSRKKQSPAKDGRTPLYSSHLEPKRPSEEEDFGERMKRIRASLEKINQLMHELKKNSTDYTH